MPHKRFCAFVNRSIQLVARYKLKDGTYCTRSVKYKDFTYKEGVSVVFIGLNVKLCDYAAPTTTNERMNRLMNRIFLLLPLLNKVFRQI